MRMLPGRWKRKDQFRWKGIWFHFERELNVYIGTVSDRQSHRTLVSFTVCRQPGIPGWFARARVDCLEYSGLEVVTAGVEGRKSGPRDALNAVCKEIANERKLALAKAWDLEACSDAIEDILWGDRGRRVR